MQEKQEKESIEKKYIKSQSFNQNLVYYNYQIWNKVTRWKVKMHKLQFTKQIFACN